MRYLLTLTQTQEDIEKLQDPVALRKKIKEMVEQVKPEFIFFSTVRRATFMVIRADDPHVQLRKISEALAENGTVTIDPVSTLEEFSKFLENS